MSGMPLHTAFTDEGHIRFVANNLSLALFPFPQTPQTYHQT